MNRTQIMSALLIILFLGGISIAFFTFNRKSPAPKMPPEPQETYTPLPGKPVELLDSFPDDNTIFNDQNYSPEADDYTPVTTQQKELTDEDISTTKPEFN